MTPQKFHAFFSGKLLARLDVKLFAQVKDFTLFAQVKGCLRK